MLASGTMMALCPMHSPEAQGTGPLPLEEIQSELIAMAEDDPLGHMLHNASEAEGRHLDSRITVQTYQNARALVEAGVGMTAVDLLHRRLGRPHPREGPPAGAVDEHPAVPADLRQRTAGASGAPARHLPADAARANLESLE